MQYKTLLAEKHTDRDSGYRLRHVKSETEYFRPHNHDYYELFLVLSGTATHIVASESFAVSQGDLIFIRDFDIHDYTNYRGGFEFINLAFDRETFLATKEFLGCDADFERLLSAKSAHTVRLSQSELKRTHLKFAELLSASSDDPARRRAMARGLLAGIFLDYLIPSRGDGEAPLWLKNACAQMQKPKNFLGGTKRFIELCEKTREHATRSLIKYYGITPTEFVNELRLNYAEGLLLNSNLSVLEICFAAGFNNVSHFYQRFRKKYGTAPKEYSKKR